MKIKISLLLLASVIFMFKASAQSPVAQWDFNENDGAVTYDAINSVEGNFTGDVTWNEDSHEGTSVMFDGDGDYINATSTDVISSLMVADNLAFTAYFNTNTLTTGQQHIVWLGTGTGNGWGPESEIHISIGHFGDFSAYGSTVLTFYYGSGDIADPDQVHIVVADPEGLDVGTWHHIAGVISNAGSDAAFGELYLDGALLTPLTPEETTYGQADEAADFVDRSTWDTGVLIGVGGNQTQRFFNGSIDAVKVFAEYLDETFINGDMIVTAKKVYGIDNDPVIFPNPVSGSVVYLKNYASIKSVEIFDVNGKSMKRVTPKSAALNVGELSSGVYVLKTTDDDGLVKSLKLLKQ